MHCRDALFALALVACGSSDPPPPRAVPSEVPPSVAPPTSVIAPPTSVIAPPASVIAPPASVVAPPAIDDAQRTAARAAVREGRAAVATSNYADALVAFQRAIAIDTGNVRLRCEAGYVAHLAGDDRQAAALVSASLAAMPRRIDPTTLPEDLRVPYAQCLYNTGLVLEGLHSPADAQHLYEMSLALRPNATVSAHLAALTAPPPPPPPPPLRPSMTDEELLVALGSRLNCPDDGAYQIDGDDDRPLVSPLVEGPSVPGVRASLFAIHNASDSRCDWSYDDVVLVLGTSDRMAAFLLLDLPQGGGTENDGEITDVSITDLVPGGLPEILITMSDEYGDTYGAGCISTDTVTRHHVVCTLEPTIACASIPYDQTVVSDCDDACLDEGEHCGREHRPPRGHHTTRPLDVSLTFTGGRAVVSVTTDREHTVRAGLVGTHDLSELIAASPFSSL